MVQILTIEPDYRKERAIKEISEIERAIKDLSAIRRKDASKKEAELLGRLKYEIWSLKTTFEGL